MYQAGVEFDSEGGGRWELVVKICWPSRVCNTASRRCVSCAAHVPAAHKRVLWGQVQYGRVAGPGEGGKHVSSGRG